MVQSTIHTHFLYTDYGCDTLGNVYSFRWTPVRKLKFYKNSYGYERFCLYFDSGRKQYLVGRFCWECVYGAIPDNLEIDHINRIQTDNRIDNLRLVTMNENHYNRSCYKSKLSSKYKGVIKNKQGKWIAQIGGNDTSKYLGVFASEIDAVHAYNEAAKKMGYSLNDI